MAQLLSNSIQFRCRSPPYCRKQKSLGLLCSSFLSLFDRDGVETIELKDACARLGVERRRLYDIVNVLESIGLLSKKEKNHYSWKGFEVIPKTLQLLKEEGPRESYTSFKDNAFLKVSDDDKGDNSCSSNSPIFQDEKLNESSDSKLSGSESFNSDNRKEKCLGLLTQNFVKLFLCSDLDMISLDEAAKILVGDVQDPSVIKSNSGAKVRRLYDIANVLSSVNLIEKTYHPETRKPVFRWMGMRGKLQMATTNDLVLDTKKRTFGTELTNTSTRRRMVAPSSVTPSQTPPECRNAKKVVDESDLEKGSIQNMKKYQFGPFAPTNVPQDKPKGNNNGTQTRDWESLALTHRPQYQNQALRDLFGHYMGAWNFYYSEVAGKNPVLPYS